MSARRLRPVGGSIAVPLLHRMLLLATLISIVQGPAAAAEDDDMAHQRADIAAQRQAVQRRFDEKARDCQERFVVTACLNAAQKERREALAPLRQEEIRIDTLQRKQRAAARLEEIEAKQRIDAAKEGSAASAAAAKASAGARPAQALPVAPRPTAPRPAAPIVAPKPRAPISEEERQHREAASLARFQASQEAAGKRHEEADARNAKRAASGKVVRPLPPPDGASSAP